MTAMPSNATEPPAVSTGTAAPISSNSTPVICQPVSSSAATVPAPATHGPIRRGTAPRPITRAITAMPRPMTTPPRNGSPSDPLTGTESSTPTTTITLAHRPATSVRKRLATSRSNRTMTVADSTSSGANVDQAKSGTPVAPVASAVVASNMSHSPWVGASAGAPTGATASLAAATSPKPASFRTRATDGSIVSNNGAGMRPARA